MSTSLVDRITALKTGLLFWYRGLPSDVDSSSNARNLNSGDESNAEGLDGFSTSAININQGNTGPSGTVSIPALTACTLSAWVKITGSAEDVNEFVRISDGGDTITLYSNTDDSLAFRSGDETNQAVATGLTSGEWHHVVLTTTATVAKLYFDGVLLSSDLADLTSVGAITSIALSVDITAESVSMQHVAGWSRILGDGGVAVDESVDPDSEIGWLYNGGEGFDPTFSPADYAFVDFNSSGIFVLNQSPIEEAGRRLNRDLKTLIGGSLLSIVNETLTVINENGLAVGIGFRVSDGNGVEVDEGASFNDAVAFTSPLAKVLRPLFDHFADVTTTSTNGTENDLYSDTLVANIFPANGAKVFAEYCLTVVGSATATRRIQVYLGGTKVLDSGTLTFASGGTAKIYITAIRVSSTVVRVKAEFIPSGITLQPVVTYTSITGLTLTNTQILKVTGIAAGTGAASGDIVAKMGCVTGMAAA